MKYWYSDSQSINIKLSVIELMEIDSRPEKFLSKVRSLISNDENIKEIKRLNDLNKARSSCNNV